MHDPNSFLQIQVGPQSQNKILASLVSLWRIVTWRMKFWLHKKDPHLLKYGGYTVLPQPRKMEDWIRLGKLACIRLGITTEMIRDFLNGKHSIEEIEQELIAQKRLAGTGQLAYLVQTRWDCVEKFVQKHKLTPETLLQLYDKIHVTENETKIHCPEVSPNLFAQETEIRYKVARAGRVKLYIFSDNDQLIKTLIDAKHAAGEFYVKWDGTNAKGEPVAPGIYFAQVDTPSYVASTRLELRITIP
jgi:hypothetical protein